MGKKVELKHQYKKLIKAGKQEEADSVLKKIWKLCGMNKTIPKIEVKSGKYIKEELEELSFKELKVIGTKFGTTDRSKKNLIKEILELQ